MDFPLLRVLFLPSLTLLLSKPVHVHCRNATTPRTCRVYGSTVVLAEGDRFFVAQLQDNTCREFYCKDFFGELSPQEVNPPHTCVTEQSCDGNFTEFERNLSICCDHCSACDFRTCPDNSSCQDQGGFTFSCPCDSGFGRTMNGPCVDLCDKSLYTSYPNDSFAVVGQQLCVTCQHNSITHTEWWREGQSVACGSNNITCNSTAGTLCFNSISHNDLNRVYSCVHRKPDFTACAVNITIHHTEITTTPELQPCMYQIPTSQSEFRSTTFPTPTASSTTSGTITDAVTNSVGCLAFYVCIPILVTSVVVNIVMCLIMIISWKRCSAISPVDSKSMELQKQEPCCCATFVSPYRSNQKGLEDIQTEKN